MIHPTIHDLLRTSPGANATVRGWIRSARHSKNVSFLDVTDGSCVAGIQVVADPSLPNHETEVRRLQTGCAIVATGKLVESPGGKQAVELHAEGIELVGDVDPDYPLQKKRHSFEFLRTIAHLRPRTNSLGAVLRVRNVASRAIHDFFQDRGFVHLHTPIITGSDCEGAGKLFRVSTLDPADPPRTSSGGVDYAQDFFGRETHLTVSGQLEGEIGALALSRVYTFGPTFRAENSNTSRHLAEFWMVEPEIAFADLDDDAALAEAFLRHLVEAVLRDCADDVAFFGERIRPGLEDELRGVVDSSFARLTYGDAIAILQESGRPFEFQPEWGADLQSEHERFLTEEHFRSPVVVTDYPKTIKPFYMYVNDDGRTVRAMDVLVPGIGEIIGGSQREHRHDVLRERIRECGLDERDYGWYLDLRRYGSVPHAGFGLGFERAIQFLTGMANIRDVVPFPRVPGSAEF